MFASLCVFHRLCNMCLFFLHPGKCAPFSSLPDGHVCAVSVAPTPSYWRQRSAALFFITEKQLFSLFEPSASAQTPQTPCTIRSLSVRWNRCWKAGSRHRGKSSVRSSPGNHCSGGGAALWSRLYPGGNDGCSGHWLNSAHLKHFQTPSVHPGGAVSFDDPFCKLEYIRGRSYLVCLDNFKSNFPDPTIRVPLDVFGFN